MESAGRGEEEEVEAEVVVCCTCCWAAVLIVEARERRERVRNDAVEVWAWRLEAGPAFPSAVVMTSLLLLLPSLTPEEGVEASLCPPELDIPGAKR